MFPVQALSQTMNTVDAAGSVVGAYMYIHLYTYIMLYYTSTSCIYYARISIKSHFQNTKSTLHLYNAFIIIAQNIFHVHTFFRMTKLVYHSSMFCG